MTIGQPSDTAPMNLESGRSIEWVSVSFADALGQDQEIARSLGPGALADALEPADYLGVSAQFVARVLAATDSKTKA